ncbi:MAG: isopentenyl phosphate kinase [Candidatus Hadarchaeales archaeon]
MARPVLVKLGGSVITDKHRPFSLRRRVLYRLARELRSARAPVVLVHGGGSFGHPLVRKYGGNLLAGFLKIHQAMVRLNSEVMEALHRAGIPAISLSPSSFIQLKGGEIYKSELFLVRWLVKRGMTPVTYGDVFPDGRGVSILSGDKLARYLALKLHAKLAIFCVDVDGIYLQEEGGITLAKEFSAKDLPKLAELPGATDVTGGMRGKVEELLKLVEGGVDVLLINGLKKGLLARALRGDRGLGTAIY